MIAVELNVTVQLYGNFWSAMDFTIVLIFPLRGVKKIGPSLEGQPTTPILTFPLGGGRDSLADNLISPPL